MNKKGYFLALGITLATFAVFVYGALVMAEKSTTASGYGNTAIGMKAIGLFEGMNKIEDEGIFVEYAAQQAVEEVVFSLSKDICKTDGIGCSCGKATNNYPYWATDTKKAEECTPSLNEFYSGKIGKKLGDYLKNIKMITGTQGTSYSYDISMIDETAGTTVVGVSKIAAPRTYNAEYQILSRFQIMIPYRIFENFRALKRVALRVFVECATEEPEECVKRVVDGESTSNFKIIPKECPEDKAVTGEREYAFCGETTREYSRLDGNRFVNSKIRYGFSVKIPTPKNVEITKFMVEGVPSDGNPRSRGVITASKGDRLQYEGEVITGTKEDFIGRICQAEICKEVKPVFNELVGEFLGEIESIEPPYEITFEAKTTTGEDKSAGVRVERSG